MAETPVDIYNLALTSIAHDVTIASPSERSREAAICRRWYEETRDQVLRSAPWSCAQAQSRLALLKERGEGIWRADDPHPNYRFAYAYPADMLHPRTLVDFEYFELSLYAGRTKAIMTDVEDAILLYTKRQNEVSFWDEDLVLAVSLTLGAYIAISLTGRRDRANDAFSKAQIIVEEAQALSANADNEEYETVPEWISARGYGNYANTRYIYPYRTLRAPYAYRPETVRFFRGRN